MKEENKKPPTEITYSVAAKKRYPDPRREYYFSDADYAAALKRIHAKRVAFDKGPG